MSELRTGQRGTIRIGCIESLAASFLPSLFAAFYQGHPQIHLKVKVNHTDKLLTFVEQGEVDLGLILDPLLHSEVLIVKELFRQPLHALVSARHPLTQLTGPLTLERVVSEPLVLLEETSRLGRISSRIFAQRGLTVHPIIEIESVEGLKELVRQGMGVTLTLPALVRPAQIGNDLALLPIADLTEEFIFALVYRRFGPIAPVARAFIKAISPSAV